MAGNERTAGVGEYVSPDMPNTGSKLCLQLLSKGELYVYSAKVIMKPAHTGGELYWHQDYGWVRAVCAPRNVLQLLVQQSRAVSTLRHVHHRTHTERS